LIIHDGSNISPQEVEDALLQHAAMMLAAVVGVPDLVHGENVRAYVTLKPGAPVPTEQELIQLARGARGLQGARSGRVPGRDALECGQGRSRGLEAPGGRGAQQPVSNKLTSA
jgi:acyl-CoA synthetase (AMP-forming)/AMP-acid ligase II